MDWFKLGYTLLGGLGIFFFGMKTLSESLQAVASHWIRKIIHTLTTNRISAVLVGLSVTCLVQSSSITTVMVVGFVNAGLMQLGQAIGVILGANIGTTITGWIISIKIGKYSLLLVGLGIFPMLFTKNERLSQIGKVLFALGLVFLGLETMSAAFQPLRSNESFLHIMQLFSAESYLSLWATVIVGCILTFIVQSSSAMLGITIALAGSGSITFQTALALVMGENIGTTITALLAGIGANTTAKRAGAAHAVFNVLGVFVLTTFFWVYMDFIEKIIGGVADFVSANGEKPFIAAHIAAGHTVFNVVNVLLFLPFVKGLEKVVIWMIPEGKEKEKKSLEFVGNMSTVSPALAIEQATGELVKMIELVDVIFDDMLNFLKASSEQKDLSRRVQKYEGITDKMQMEITVFLGKVMQVSLTEEESQQIKSILRMADELESIADYCASIMSYSGRVYSEQFTLDEQTKQEVYALADRSLGLYDSVKSAIIDRSSLDIEELRPIWRDFNRAADEMKATHIARMGEGKFLPVASLTLSDIVVAFRRIKNHTVNLAEAYVHAE